MTPHATVGVDDDLAPGETAIALRASDDESSRRIDVVFRLGVEELRGNDCLDDVLFDFFPQRLDLDQVAVLAGNDDGVDPDRLALIVFHRHLALPVGPQVVEGLVLPDLGKPPHQLVGEGNRHRHELFGLVAGVAEHEPLVAGATRVHAHGDVR